MIQHPVNPIIKISHSALDVRPFLVSCEADFEEVGEHFPTNCVIILPSDHREFIAFPEGTRELFYYLRDSLHEGITIDVAARDEDYAEIALHSEDIILPALYVAGHALLPIVIDILSAYISKFIWKGDDKDGTVSSTVHFVARNGATFTMEYDGPASTFENAVMEMLNRLDDPQPEEEG